MYNEKRKEEFIQLYSKSMSTQKACRNVFNAFEKYEEAWGADLCTRSTEELQPIINMIVGLRGRTKWARLIILKKYVKWCIGTGVDGATSGMLDITHIGLEKMRQETIPNPSALQQYLNSIFVPPEKNTTSNVYHCYCWLAYMGFAEEDILKVKISDVDLDKMIIHYPERGDVQIYKAAIPCIKNCVERDDFVFQSSHYETTIPRVEGNTLVRGIKQQPNLLSIRSIVSRTAKANEEKTGMRLSYFRIWLSGVFYRKLIDEINGEQDINFEDIVAIQTARKTYKLDSGRNTISDKKKYLAREYKDDYDRWKLTWRL